LSRYEFYLTDKALKELNKLESKVRERILEALITLRDYGFTRRLDIKKLRGYKNHYRIRVRDYRILFELDKPRKIIVYAILPRKKVY
jgi:mRNA interferase RelE/StbE